jgi:hypothetical protein
VPPYQPRPRQKLVEMLTFPATTNDVETTPSEELQTPVYRVDKSSHVVFKAMFHTDNDGEPACKIRWSEVVTAFTKLSSAAEKLHGLAWQLTPRKLKLYCGILFHEPHPDDEVPLTLARRYGRRLARAYGRDGTMFKRK